MELLVNSTPIALWHDIIHEAEHSCAITLHEDVESYLVFLLVRYTNKPEMTKHIMAYEFLTGLKRIGEMNKQQALQDVGDKCLLFTGLFPKIAAKRLVKVSYFVNIGKSAYETISKKQDDLYYSLAHQFVPLMDVLQSVRRYSSVYPDLLPLEAYELWNETGSQRALSVLRQYTKGSPIKGA